MAAAGGAACCCLGPWRSLSTLLLSRPASLQGSPTLVNTQSQTYRHALAVTAWRPAMDGTPFLYTLNVACRWAPAFVLLGLPAPHNQRLARSTACCLTPPCWLQRGRLLWLGLVHTVQPKCAAALMHSPPAFCARRQELWEDLEPQFKAAIESFTMLATTDAYIPPDKNPWLFF
jgi:hypothetical protein